MFLLTVLLWFNRLISQEWCDTNRATPFAPACTSDLAPHISCLPRSASSNRRGWFQDLTEVPATRSPLYLAVFALRLFVFGQSESSGAWDRPSWRKPNIDREGNLFILQGDIWAREVLGSSAPSIYILTPSVLFRQGWGKFSQHRTAQNIEPTYWCRNL